MVNHLKDDLFIYLMEDVTHMKLLEEQLKESKSHLESEVLSRTKQLQEALEIKSKFLAVMSHGTYLCW